MNQQPDKLFREKLQGFQKPVPEDAWKRISANLHPARHYLGLKIAATVVALAVATLLLFPFKKGDVSKNIAGNQSREKIHVPPRETREADAQGPSAPADKPNPATGPTPKPGNHGRVKKAQTVPDRKNETGNEGHEEKESGLIPEIAQRESPEETAGLATEPSAETERATERITIIFTAKEVDEKYLDKKEIAQATGDGKKSSSLRKLLDKAYDLKHNQDPLGELRQKKNEIFAFNFRNDKTQHE